MAVMAPGMTGLSEPQQRLFLLVLTLIQRFRGTGLEASRDADVADAAGALASTYETEVKGLIYEHRAATGPAQRMAAELRTVLDRIGREHPAALARDAAVVLRRIEKLVRDPRNAPPQNPTAMLDVIGRVARRVTAAGLADEPGVPDRDRPPTTEPSIILP